jgi:hypothetical protein
VARARTRPPIRVRHLPESAPRRSLDAAREVRTADARTEFAIATCGLFDGAHTRVAVVFLSLWLRERCSEPRDHAISDQRSRRRP